MKVIDLKQIKEDCVEEIAETLYKEVDTNALDNAIDNTIDTLGEDVYIGNMRYRFCQVLEKLNKEQYDKEWLNILYGMAEDVYYEISESEYQWCKKFGIEFQGKN